MADIKQYVNLDPSKSDELKEIKPERAGRVIHVLAKIDKKVGGVPVVFEIISGSKNVFPSLDKANFSRQEVKQLTQLRQTLPGLQMPMSAKRKVITNDDGEAEIDFTLSGFGGDEFEVKAYIYKSGGNKGNELKSDKYIVWRRIYYQVSRFKSGKVGSNRKGNLPEVPRFDWQPVKAEFEARKHNIELVDDSRVDTVARYKNVLIPESPYDDLKYSAKKGYIADREPVSMRVVLANIIAEPRTDEINPYIVIEKKIVDIDVNIGELWIDESLPIGSDCIVSAHLKFHKNDAARPINGVFIYALNQSKIRIRFDLMEQSAFETSFGKKPVKARLTLKLRLLEGSTNGLSWYNAIWLAHNSMHDSKSYSAEGKQSTAIHEIGHFVNMVDNNQSTWYEEHGHTGPHCFTGLSTLDEAKVSYRGLNGTCVMFGEGDGRATKVTNFCSECDPFLRKTNVRIKDNMPSISVSWI